MKQFSIISMIIGIGIGIIVTSIINLVYYGDQSKDTSNTDENPFITIIQHSEDSDVVEHNEVMETNSEKNIEPSYNELHTEVESAEEQEIYNSIYITRGMNSEEIAQLLFDEKIINSSEDFIRMANKLGVTSHMRFGYKKIPVGSSLEDILKILTEI